MSDFDRCRHCGERRRDHGGPQNPHRPYACPRDGREPKWPTSIKDEARAGTVYDARLRKHWTARTTVFEART